MSGAMTSPRLRTNPRIAFVVLLVFAASAHAAPSNVAAWRRNGLVNQELGSSVGTAGDFNCDGISDLAIETQQAIEAAANLSARAAIAIVAALTALSGVLVVITTWTNATRHGGSARMPPRERSS